MRCVFPEAIEDCKEGYVYSIDYASYGVDNPETKKARIWFAKLMGVYFDVLTKKKGYTGPEDIYMSFYGTTLEYSVNKKEYFSLINNLHLDTKNVACQMDNFNCGVITCLSCMKFSNKDQEWITKQEEISSKKCALWREKFCSFLYFVTEELNKLPLRESPTSTDNATPIKTTNSPLESMLPTENKPAKNPFPKKLEQIFRDLDTKVDENASINQSFITPAKKKSVSTYDAESTSKFLHRTHTTTKKDRRVKFNAREMSGTTSTEPIGTQGKGNYNNLSSSLLDQLVEILSSRLYHGKENVEEYFKDQMEMFDTFYVTDHEYYVPSTTATASAEPKFENHTIMTVAIIELVDFGDWTYKHKSVVAENKVAVEREVKGFKTKNKAILIHHFATRLFYERNGYGSHLLKWIGESYHGHALYVYIILQAYSEPKNASEDDKKIDAIEREAAHKFFLGCKFEIDKSGKNFGLSVVDTKNKSQESITSNENTVYRTTTSKLRNIAQKYLYGTTRFAKLDRNYITKICYSRRYRDLDNFLNFLKSENKKVLVYDVDEKEAFEEGVARKEKDSTVSKKRKSKQTKPTSKKPKVSQKGKSPKNTELKSPEVSNTIDSKVIEEEKAEVKNKVTHDEQIQSQKGTELKSPKVIEEEKVEVKNKVTQDEQKQSLKNTELKSPKVSNTIHSKVIEEY